MQRIILIVLFWLIAVCGQLVNAKGLTMADIKTACLNNFKEAQCVCIVTNMATRTYSQAEYAYLRDSHFKNVRADDDLNNGELYSMHDQVLRMCVANPAWRITTQ